ncbi:hypothetical protein IE53DRAFT_388149 [Violaceomyces palustris]|uniref:Uncharacterized protein n=1 Tax=Violaceomyces palustris TaxID=1673888 RepID=A0ACD0NUZ4_9BASI|nr:hypothetical protein IE53DRAFT_388149 [Violaceomyces palustris]
MIVIRFLPRACACYQPWEKRVCADRDPCAEVVRSSLQTRLPPTAFLSSDEESCE